MLRHARRLAAKSIWNLTAGLAIALIGSSATGARQARTAANGIFTDAQARRGEGVYAQQCASCHAADLSGSGAPALAGQDFLDIWNEMSIADLVEKIATSMPTSAPGSLGRGQVTDLVAFILESNDFPAGSAELDSDDQTLGTIDIAR